MDSLLDLAREAMRQRGLQPDFPPAAQHEAAALTDAPPAPDAAVRDLRDLLWCSIDNDDSRDLDQLTVALPERDGRAAHADRDRRRRRAGAPGRRDRRPRAHQHHLGLHGGRRVPDAAAAAVDRPQLAERAPGPRGDRDRDRDRAGRPRGGRTPSRRSTARWCATARSSTYNAVAAWLDGDGAGAAQGRGAARAGGAAAHAGPRRPGAEGPAAAPRRARA